METPPSFRDDFIASLLAFGTGAAAGLPLGWLSGVVSYVTFESDCGGEAMCGLGAAVWGALIGLVVGALAFAAAASWSIHKHVGAGRRLRAGVLTFIVVPIGLTMLLSLGGLF